MNTDTQAPDFQTALAAFVVAAQVLITARFANSPNCAPSVLSIGTGRKWIRLVLTTSTGQRSAYGFVNIETGELWKHAGWARPAKNFPRGSIYSAKPLGGQFAYSIG